MSLQAENHTPLNEGKLTPEQILKKQLGAFSCLIEEHTFSAIMKNQTHFIQSATQADIVTVCIKQQDHFSLEFLGANRRQLISTLRQYKVKFNNLKINDFLAHFKEDIKDGNQTYTEVRSLERIFDGVIDQEQYPLFEKEIGFTSAVIYPIFTRKHEEIGYIIYFYLNKHQPKFENLPLMTSFFESVIQPLYDSKSRTFYSKLERISFFVPELTPAEKRITRRMLDAHSNSKIANDMHISVNTVKTHVKNIFNKYNVNSKMELSKALKQVKI